MAQEGRVVELKESSMGRLIRKDGSSSTSGRGSVSGDGDEAEDEASALPAASRQDMTSGAKSVGGAGGVGRVGTAHQGDSESDEEGEVAVLEEGNSDEEIEVGSGDGRTELEDEVLSGRPWKTARTVKEDVD